MSDDLIPFGKYRGQPLATLAADKQYAEWLTGQPWFRERYSSLYTVVINNFTQSDDSPEHNVLQARFLDKNFCRAFLSLAARAWPITRAKRIAAEIEGKWPQSKEDKEALSRLTRIANNDHCVTEISARFEVKGIDVCLSALCCIEEDYPPSAWRGLEVEKRVEIKPVVGDDYPTVLRQMKAIGADTLYLNSYNGEGITQEQLIQIFENEAINVIFQRDVERLL